MSPGRRPVPVFEELRIEGSRGAGVNEVTSHRMGVYIAPYHPVQAVVTSILVRTGSEFDRSGMLLGMREHVLKSLDPSWSASPR